MYKNKKIGVVIPAYNEEKFIGCVIKTIPQFVDRIYVVNDASTDSTLGIALEMSKRDGRVAVINRQIRGGVGAAIASGHIRALKEEMDIVAVMAGDGQMDPAILSKIIDPVAEGRAEYAKGDRISNPENRKGMPKWRLFGNLILTLLTRFVSGYWDVSDPQNGYTALSTSALRKLDLGNIEKGFAFENDMLVKLNVVGARVVDVPHPAIYRGQNSKIRYYHFILSTSWVLLKDLIWRIWVKSSDLNVLFPKAKKKEL
ncbi:TPA: glycosyltransferase family 2 protein [Candidatus Poribacteria bacterium]|nr:glycosyltransferase family 2 protein [Candidatus Poribacteria bacterium]